MIQVRWTGAAGLAFSYDGGVVLIDPYFTRPGLGRALLGRIAPDREIIDRHIREMDPIRAVVVGHTHFDHALDIPVIAGMFEGVVLGSRSLETLLDAHGLERRVRVCEPGEKVSINESLSVTMLPSVHGRVLMGKVPYPGEIETGLRLPMKTKEYRLGQVYAPKIKIKDRVFLHLGSAGFVDATLKGGDCDVLFLCVPGWNRMPGYPERVIEAVRPDTVVLFHHDNFFKPLKPDRTVQSLGFIKMKQLKDRIRKAFPDVRLLSPSVYESMSF